MQEYIDFYDERAIEIEKNFSYDGYQIVRREMFAHQREPSVTIRSDSITFNTACIEGLEDAVYIHVLVSDSEKRMVIKKCAENDLDAVRWCVAKPDKRRSRNVKGRFSEVIFKLMTWSKGCRYKILGHKITFQGETLYVFELENCEIFKERPKRTKAEREARANSMTPEELAEADRLERRASMIPFSPADVENTFGLPVDEHRTTIEIGTMSGYREMQAGKASESGDSAMKSADDSLKVANVYVTGTNNDFAGSSLQSANAALGLQPAENLQSSGYSQTTIDQFIGGGR